jgi:uncharacterized protein YybS (DUF2232 family)
MTSRARHPTRGLTEGAILAGLTAVTAAVGLVAPFVGILVAPLPIMLLVIRWNPRLALLGAIVATLILLEIFGPLNAISAAVGFAPLGLALGWGVRRGWGAPLTVLLGACSFLLATLVMLTGTSLVLHQDLIAEFVRSQVRAMQMAVSFQERLGAPKQQIQQMQATVAALPGFLHATLPVIFALGALVWSYTCYTVARHVLRRVGHQLPGFRPILEWRISPSIASVLLLASGTLALSSLISTHLSSLALDVLLADFFIFAFQGALVGVAWMNRHQVPRAAQVLLGFLLLSIGLLPLLALTVLGTLDTWLDYRRLTSPRDRESGPAPPVPRTEEGAPARTEGATKSPY